MIVSRSARPHRTHLFAWPTFAAAALLATCTMACNTAELVTPPPSIVPPENCESGGRFCPKDASPDSEAGEAGGPTDGATDAAKDAGALDASDATDDASADADAAGD